MIDLRISAAKGELRILLRSSLLYAVIRPMASHLSHSLTVAMSNYKNSFYPSPKRKLATRLATMVMRAREMVAVAKAAINTC